MATEPRPDRDDDEADARRLAAIATDLADGIDAALPGWVERSVVRILVAWQGEADAGVVEQARAAGLRAQLEIGSRVRSLLDADIDEQRTGPLAIVRGAVRYPTEVLRAAGVPAVVRDDFAEAHAPDDLYDLTPASFADLDPALREPGLAWGAAKAHIHLQRRRRAGQR